jgi:hypothetical protein
MRKWWLWNERRLQLNLFVANATSPQKGTSSEQPNPHGAISKVIYHHLHFAVHMSQFCKNLMIFTYPPTDTRAYQLHINSYRPSGRYESEGRSESCCGIMRKKQVSLR